MEIVILTRHLLYSLGITYVSNESIHYDSAKEIYEYCVRQNLPDAWAYLYRNWYTTIQYHRWAKSAINNMIPIGKTTMLIEAHWKVLKRTHLYHYNRARLDLVTYVIIQHYYKKLKVKYQSQVVFRQETSTFEKVFMQTWNKRHEADASNNLYTTDLDRWVCGCQSFLHSPVSLCKHLVQGYMGTHTRQLVNRQQFIKRSHTPPFIQFLPVKKTQIYYTKIY
jgi:hypothetical protein